MSQHLSFMVFGADAESLNRIDAALATSDRATLLSSAQNERQVRIEIGRLRPSAAIIVLGESPEERLSLIRDLTRAYPETMLIGAASDASPDLILNSLRAGASEFLRLPLLDDEFATILDHAEEYASRQAGASKPRGRVIAVFSNKGGCGTSFIASNLALALGAPTVLVDLNFQTGDLGFFFQVEPKFSILNLCENLDRMDEELLSGFLANYSPQLSLLPAPTDLDEALEVRAGHVTAVIDLLRNTHDFVVLDLPHTFDEITLAAFDDADEILVVTTLDIMAVRNMQRVVSTLERLDCPREKIRAVINRWNKGDLDVGQAQIERLFSKNLMTLIPNDYRAAAGSINLGQPLVGARKSNAVASEIKRLAVTLAASSTTSGDSGGTAAATGSTNSKGGKVSHAPTSSSNGTATDAVPVNNGNTPAPSGSKWKGKISSLLRTG